jgi:hypothetical protein
MLTRLPFLFLTAALVVPAMARAQQDSARPKTPPAGPQVLDHVFTLTAGERVRVFLAGGATYRAELDGAGIRLRLRPAQPGTQAPLVQPVVTGRSASGISLFTIRPRADGEYDFQTVGGDPGRPVRLRLSLQTPPKPRP